MKVGAAIGTVGGVARGVSAAWQVVRLAQLLARSPALSKAGAIFGDLAGGVGGCALGESLDYQVLAPRPSA